MMRFYCWMEEGWLPVSGGLLDQSALFLEASEVIRKARSDFEEMEKKMGAGGR